MMVNDGRGKIYKHKALKWSGEDNRRQKTIPIRLLKLHPTSGSALVGSIVERAEGQRYEALSYCWGSSSESIEPHYIKIVEDNHYSELQIRPNLASALKQMRNREGEYRYLWIDAISIDQEKNAEKSEQIPLMDRIFQEAERVCIWLGDETGEEDEVALKHIKDIVKLQGFENLIQPDYTDKWAALASLMRREWFSRRWVVQEIAYAREAVVYWGTQSIDWKELADAVALFGSKAPEIAELFRQDKKYNHRGDFLGDVEALSANRLVQTIGKVFRKADNGTRVEKLLSLEALVSNLSAFNASRPHDIIYAVLSLAKDTITSAVKPTLPPRRHSIAGISRPRARTLSPGPISGVGIAVSLENGTVFDPRGSSWAPMLPDQDLMIAFHWEGMSDKDCHARIREQGFKNKDIESAKKRIELHASCVSKPFNYEEMIAKVNRKHKEEKAEAEKKAIAGDENEATAERENKAAANQRSGDKIDGNGDEDASPVITKRFWSIDAQDGLYKGGTSHWHLTIKLLLQERGYHALMVKFFLTLQGRVNVKTFHVDYEKKFYEVCKDFINFTIKSSRSLDMLCRPWAPEKDDLPDSEKDAADLPSWICPLSKSPFRPRPDGNFGRVNADLLVGVPDAGGSPYSTSATTVPEQYFFGGQDQRSLFVTGLVIDEIGDTATEAIEGNIPSSWLKLGDWNNAKTEAPPESFWRTIVADRNENGQNPPSYYQRACQYAFGQRTAGGSLNTDRLINSKISQVMTDYLKRVQAVVWMRKLIRTKYSGPNLEAHASQQSPQLRLNGDVLGGGGGRIHNGMKGRLGLVPHTAQTGDQICMLRGCSVPVILRRLDNNQEHDGATRDSIRRLRDQATGNKWQEMACKLIGECYIHGIMDGEVFRIASNNKTPVDTIFEIR